MSETKIAAFMDIGTNSLRLLLVRINENDSYTILSDQKELVRLGEGEFAEQWLQPEAMKRATLVCKQFAEMARSYKADEIIAVATSATREAQNREEFLRHLKREAGLYVRVVSGREEARLIYQGVSSGVHLGEKHALFVDIGGGSTELIIGDQNHYDHLDSVKLGAIRLTSLFFLPRETGPVAPQRYALLQQYIRNSAVRAFQQLRQYSPSLAYGSSGTIENLADIAIELNQKRRRGRDDVLVYTELQKTIDTLCGLSLDERRKVPGINPERADIIIAGAAILDTIMGDLQIPEIRISDRGLRDGLLVEYLERQEQHPVIDPATPAEKLSVRAQSVLQLGRSCNFDEKHARHVSGLVLKLFDSAKEIGLHKLGKWERELLDYASLVHDIGSFLSYQSHQQHSYYMIRNADLLGFDQTEISIMAATGLFHRKALPSRKKHPEFAALGKKSQRAVRVFAVLLRIAESLDRSHSGTVCQAEFHSGAGNTILLKIQANSDPQLEVWGVENHRNAFWKVFRKKLVVQVNERTG